jgi:hypothetical protein
MKARNAVLLALAAAVTLTSVAAAGPGAAKQRVAIWMRDLGNGTFVLTPLQPGTLKRDSGTVSGVFKESATVMREGQSVFISRNTYTFKGKRGTMSIRERNEFVNVSNEKVKGFDFTPGIGIGTWKVVGGTRAYAKITGGGRSGVQGHPWLAQLEGFLTSR